MNDLSKSQISEICKLHQHKFRTIEGKFIAEGVKMINELLSSEWSYEKIFYTDSRFLPDNLNIIDDRIVKISSKSMSRISLLKTEPGVLAIIEQQPASKPDLNDQNVTLVLDRINDPGNFGSIIRTADWFGVKNVICTKGCVDRFNPKVVQSTMGSIFRVDVQYLEFQDLEMLLDGFDVYISDISGESISDLKVSSPVALVVGSESHGVDERFLSLSKRSISIPGGLSGVESLNASVACGILLYHMSM